MMAESPTEPVPTTATVMSGVGARTLSMAPAPVMRPQAKGARWWKGMDLLDMTTRPVSLT